MNAFGKMFGGALGVLVALGLAGVLLMALCAGCLMTPTLIEPARKAAREAQRKAEAQRLEQQHQQEQQQ